MLTGEELLRLQNGNGVSGIALRNEKEKNVTLTEEAANRIAGGFVLFLEQKTLKPASELKVAIGHDSRLSSDELTEAAKKAMLSMGVRVVDCGLAPAPAMFMSTLFPETSADGAVMVTGGKEVFTVNGFKFYTMAGCAEEEDIRRILEHASELPEQNITEGASAGTGGSTQNAGKCYLVGIYSKYLSDKLREALGGGEEPLSGRHIVVDAGSGSGGFFAEKILSPMGADIKGSLFLEPDGHFPGHIPDPGSKEAMEALKNAVLLSGADFGLSFDAGMERLSAVSGNGVELKGSSLIGAVAEVLAPDYPWSTVVTDLPAGNRLSEFMENELGMGHFSAKTGDIIKECRRLNGEGKVSPLAMDSSGRGVLSENYYLEDGACLALKLIISLAKETGGTAIDFLSP
ncbi:MAG: phosphomannomutase/phosphoglucomutase [Lachnospiraceae bacterium]|nr:phosphomannomutase/phosphoglucomutase [Lachnospiraceae bacterium]